MDKDRKAAAAILAADDKTPGRGAAIAGELLLGWFERDGKAARAVFRALARRMSEEDQARVADLIEDPERIAPGGPHSAGYARKQAARYPAVVQAASRRIMREKAGIGPVRGKITEHAEMVAARKQEGKS